MISFVIAMEDIKEPDDPDQHQAARTAALQIAEWFGIGAAQKSSHPARSAPTAPTQPPPARLATEMQPTEQPADEPLVNAPLKFELRDLDANHAYLLDRGFTPETTANFGVGYFSGRGIMSGRVAVPIHDVDGTLVAYAGRWPGSEPPEGSGKYRLPNGFHKSILVYNMHRAKACAREHGLVLVEGYFDVMRLHQLGVCHAVALMGSAMSQAQEDLIVDAVGPQGKVTLLFDGDTSGRTCTQDALARLGGRVYTKALILPDGKQPDQLTKDELRQLGR
jgi:DNA primase